MKTIYKYPLPRLGALNQILMPSGARILSANMQGSNLCVWALVDPDAEMVVRTFVVRGTGHPCPNTENLAFVDTVQAPPFVWHLFDGGEG